jgi:hypothetical protein
MTRTRIILLALAALIGIIVLGKIFFQDDDAEIRALLEEMINAAEERSTQEFMKHFSLKYKDSSGNNYFIIQQLVKRTFDQVEDLKVEVKNTDISVAKDSAYVTLEVLTRARIHGQITHPFGSEQAPEMPRLTLKKERLDWKIVKVEGVEGSGYFSDEF